MAGDFALSVGATQSTPLDYPIPNAALLVLKCLTANYNGAAAGASYVPCVQILYAGVTVGTFTIGSTVAAGASADCSWFPGVAGGAAAAASTGAGIQYGGASPTYGAINTGQWLEVNTTLGGGDQNVGLYFNDESSASGGVIIQTASGFGMQLNSSGTGPHAGGIFLNTTNASNSGIQMLTAGTGNQGYQITSQDPSNNGVTVTASGTGNGGITLNVQGTAASGILLTSTAAIGVEIDVLAANTAYLKITGLPSAAAGLPAGAVWNNAGVLNIV